jgi:hypothetical protein
MKHRNIRRHVEDTDWVLAWEPVGQRWFILWGKRGIPAHRMNIIERHPDYATAKQRFDYIIPDRGRATKHAGSR